MKFECGRYKGGKAKTNGSVDLTGRVFGYLTVLHRTVAPTGYPLKGYYWWACRCRCGVETLVDSYRLQAGRTKACRNKCYQKGKGINGQKDLAGMTFGFLTVLRKAPLRPKWKYRIYWVCRCKCGTETEAESYKLQHGDIKACRRRCYQISTSSVARAKPRLTPEERSFRRFLHTYASSKNAKRYCFSLTEQEFRKVTQEPCAYCGTPPSLGFRTAYATSPYVCNGVDRVDSSKGYETGNVVACCTQCNRMKLDTQVDKFLLQIARIYKHHQLGTTYKDADLVYAGIINSDLGNRREETRETIRNVVLAIRDLNKYPSKLEMLRYLKRPAGQLFTEKEEVWRQEALRDFGLMPTS